VRKATSGKAEAWKLTVSPVSVWRAVRRNMMQNAFRAAARYSCAPSLV
jgi:hypothetical protein